MSVSRGQILDLLEQSISGEGLVGGRRRGRPRKRRPSRRYRGRGEFDEMPMYHPAMEHQESQMHGDGYGYGIHGYGEGVIGRGLVGGARRRKRRVGSKKPMSAAVKKYLKDYRKMHGKRKRRSVGRGLVGGMIGGSIYDELVEELEYSGYADPEAVAKTIIKDNKDLLKFGVRPSNTKQTLIKRIRGLEMKLGMKSSSDANLEKYSVAALRDILNALRSNIQIFKYPPRNKRNALNDEEDPDDIDFTGFLEEAPKRYGQQERQQEEV
jgi:hypothetical protein